MHPLEKPPSLPAEGAYNNQSVRTRAAGKAGKSKHHQDHPRRRTLTRVPRAAIDLYLTLPPELTRHIPEHGSQRILRALTAELQHRTPAELADRITRNWDHWRYRITDTDPIRDAVAVTTRLVRRGQHCPDVRCEDGHQLDLDAFCKACLQLPSNLDSANNVSAHREPPSTQLGTAPAPSRGPTIREAFSTSSTNAATKGQTYGQQRHAALARRLLGVRSAAEREALISAHLRAHTSMESCQWPTTPGPPLPSSPVDNLSPRSTVPLNDAEVTGGPYEHRSVVTMKGLHEAAEVVT